jgi:hypothetical protein
MESIGAFYSTVIRQSDRLGECSQAGLLVGAVSGGLLSLLSFLHGGHHLTFSLADAVWIALLLTAFGWLVLLLVFVGLLRRRFSSVALPSLVNAFLVTVVTLAVSVLLHLLILAWLIGIIAGSLIGYLLCLTLTRLTGRGDDDGQ